MGKLRLGLRLRRIRVRGVADIYVGVYTQARFPPRPVMGRGVMPILYFSRSAKGSAFHRWPATINTIRAKARARPRARVRARVRARARARVEACSRPGASHGRRCSCPVARAAVAPGRSK